jgi:polyisoprenoid-binding protein YceI
MSVITTPTVASRSWVVDPVHSSVGFAVRHLGGATFRGSFDGVQGALADGGLSGRVDVDTISVSQPDLRGHLLSPEFFDAERHGEIVFRSTAIRQDPSGDAEVEGELTLRGVTRPVRATGTVGEPFAGMTGGEVVAVELQATVDRREFGLDWQVELPGGRLTVDWDVTISVSLELTPEA